MEVMTTKLPRLLHQEVDVREAGKSTKMNPVRIHLFRRTAEGLQSKEVGAVKCESLGQHSSNLR